jgi:hypothetical protein
VTDSPAYGARNVSRVAAGTGEALPGPVTCGVVAGDPTSLDLAGLKNVDGFWKVARRAMGSSEVCAGYASF